ncbi:MAG: UDP-N-acetylmuramoyl-tripeptide--D-alanyl-D-alanine ligase, partial [Planctomycetota bacterium]
MFPITVEQLAHLIGASAHPSEPHEFRFPQLRDVGQYELDDISLPQEVMSQELIVAGASIDSRSITASSSGGPAFFALAGEKNHGIHFAADALRNGAACVVTDRPLPQHMATAAIRRRGDQIHAVTSSVQALQTLGHWNRRQFEGLMIGVTGSVGKTTTRQMIHAVLTQQFSGIQSPRNFNNELGVPLTLCELNAGHDFCVLEMGAGRLGDIAALATIAEPELGVVTRVAPAHLASMGTIDGIQYTKQELIESLPEHGHAFLNADDPRVRSMANVCRAQVTMFGTSSDSDVRAEHICFRNGMTHFTVDGVTFQLHGGAQLITSALAAISIGRLTGVTMPQTANAIAGFRPDAGRGHVVSTTPWTIIDDSYNASPASVSACIQNLSDWSASARRILVLGDMLELGQETEPLHAEIGRLIAQS